MIELKIGLDGVPSEKKITLGNQWENKDEYIHFDLPQEFDSYYKYLVAVKTMTDAENVTVVLPINENRFIITSSITYLAGAWNMYVMCRQGQLDLSDDKVDLSAAQGEHIFISDGFTGLVTKNLIDKESIENMPMDSNLKTIYDDLVVLKKEILQQINSSYDGIANKPSINGVELLGNQTLYDFGYVPIHRIDVKSFPALYLAIKNIGVALDSEDESTLLFSLFENNLIGEFNGNIVKLATMQLYTGEYNPISDISTVRNNSFVLTIDKNGIVEYVVSDTDVELDALLATKLDINQGAENANKILTVGVDGIITLVDSSNAITVDETDLDSMLEGVYGNV